MAASVSRKSRCRYSAIRTTTTSTANTDDRRCRANRAWVSRAAGVAARISPRFDDCTAAPSRRWRRRSPGAATGSRQRDPRSQGTPVALDELQALTFELPPHFAAGRALQRGLRSALAIPVRFACCTRHSSASVPVAVYRYVRSVHPAAAHARIAARANAPRARACGSCDRRGWRAWGWRRLLTRDHQVCEPGARRCLA
jgi:hypothetical protein